MQDYYLKETFLLDFSSENIQNLINDRNWKRADEYTRIKKIYDYVRDEILLDIIQTITFRPHAFSPMDMVNVIQRGSCLWRCSAV